MGGGDKTRIRVGGKTILKRVLARLEPQCAAVILNANGDPARFSDTGLPVVPDTVPGFAGPLAGILAGLDWTAAHAPAITDVASVPGDCPFLPGDLVARLSAVREAAGVPLACARSGDWRHPVVGLWPVALRQDLRKALIANATALDAWKDITPLARNEFICWVEDAKQETTRERRIRRTQEELEEGQRRPCCWPGCKHRERTGR